MFSTARPAIFCLSVISGLISLASQAAAEKVPVPPPAAQAESLKLIKSIFTTEYASTDRKTLAKLAGQLYKQAMQSGDDRAAQFTLLREAITVGVKAGDVDAAVSASEAMIASFRV